jgi:hypothetical protein
MRDELRAMASRQGVSLARDPSKRELIEELLVRAARRSLPLFPLPSTPCFTRLCLPGIMHADPHFAGTAGEVCDAKPPRTHSLLAVMRSSGW